MCKDFLHSKLGKIRSHKNIYDFNMESKCSNQIIRRKPLVLTMGEWSVYFIDAFGRVLPLIIGGCFLLMDRPVKKPVFF
jgi:hypothetical protein